MSSVPHWALRALQECPRLQVYARADGSYIITSTDDVVLYLFSDARYLDQADPAFTRRKEYWRTFLKRPSGEVVTEFRRHYDPASAVGMTVKCPSRHEGVKTGLQLVSSQYGVVRYSLHWIQDQLFFFDTTHSAPNTSYQDPGSLACITDRGQKLAWLIRAKQDQSHNLQSEAQQHLVATLWFEEEALREDNLEMILSGLLAITDIQYPILVTL